MLVVAWCAAGSSVYTRKLQRLHFTIVVFYYAIAAFTLLAIFIFCGGFITGQPIQLFTYTKEQYAYTLASSILTTLQITCLCIANQNDNPAFLTILAQLVLFYSFVADVTLFDESFTGLQVAGVALILVMNIALVTDKLKGNQLQITN